MLLSVEELAELHRREKEQGITPDPALEAFMQAEIRQGKRDSIIADFVIKILALDVSLHLAAAHVCAEVGVIALPLAV